VDSETKVHNLHIGGEAIFPDTRALRFTNEQETLLSLLYQKTPLDENRKVPLEHLPETFLRNTYFSGAKISTSSNTMLAQRNAEQFINLDQKFYDYDGYVYSQKSPPGGYKFCVIKEGIYGIGLHLKYKHGYNASYLKVTAKVEREEVGTYDVSLIDKQDVEGGSTELLYTGIVELFLDEGDCVYFTIEQDQQGIIWGGYSTYATVHKIVRIPETGNTNATVDPPAGSVFDCEDARDCFWCPDGITSVVNDVVVTAPSGYLYQPESTLELKIDNVNCQAELSGVVELPPPSYPVECNPEELVSCIASANVSPEDLGLVFSDAQILAIASGYVTNDKYGQLEGVVSSIQDTITNSICELVQPCINAYVDSKLCSVLDSCNVVFDSDLGATLSLIQPNHGVITVSPQSQVYQQGTTVSLSVTPNEGYDFVQWMGDASGVTSPLDLVLDKSAVVAGVELAKKTYVLTVTDPLAGGSFNITGFNTYKYGDVVTVTLTKELGWSIDAWGGAAVGEDTAQTSVDILMDGDKSVEVALLQNGVSEMICGFDNGFGIQTDVGYKGPIRITVSGWGSAYPDTLSDAFYRANWSGSDASNFNEYAGNDFRVHSNFDWKLQVKTGSQDWISGITAAAKEQYPLGDGRVGHTAEHPDDYPEINWSPSTEPVTGQEAIDITNSLLGSTAEKGDHEYVFDYDAGDTLTELCFRMFSTGVPSADPESYDAWQSNNGTFWVKVEVINDGEYGPVV
jgi:hypothetical protein